MKTNKTEKNLFVGFKNDKKPGLSPIKKDKDLSFIKGRTEREKSIHENEKPEKFNHTVVIGKDLKFIENNIIFLPPSFITKQDKIHENSFSKEKTNVKKGYYLKKK